MFRKRSQARPVKRHEKWPSGIELKLRFSWPADSCRWL